MKVLNLTKGEAIKELARAGGPIGQQIEFHDPDESAEAIYSYHTESGKLVKQVLRYPGKRFAQRRPASGGGWSWDVQGVKPLLYNLLRVRYANTICICEGEKDCDRVNSLNLRDVNGHEVVATTSGGAESWRPVFAEDLRGKRVAILPDRDEPGQKYATQVAESLSQSGIAWRIAGFEDSGVKDVSEFLERGYSADDLAEHIGADWIRLGNSGKAHDLQSARPSVG